MTSTHPALAVAGTVDARALEALLLAALSTGVLVVRFDLSAVEAADLATVDALARLQLAARRRGGWIRLRGVGPELAGLLDLAGLGALVER